MTSARPARDRQVLHVQYANPAAYPPILHGAKILADDGWSVRMLGVEMDGTESLRVPPHPNVSARRLPIAPVGWKRRVQYARFVALALAEVVRMRPAWVYASDAFSAPVAAAVARLGLARVVYHEHDAPGVEPVSAFMRRIYAARRHVARTANLLVAPNQTRLDALVSESRRTGPSVCVWNVPSVREVAPARTLTGGPLTLYYHGSLNSLRLPFELLDAMATIRYPFRLHVVGYETIGSQGFTDAFEAAARRVGVADRVTVSGPQDRADIMALSRQADIGLAFMPMATDDLNMRAMPGASNKPFDYLASGLALLVSDRPEWKEMYEAPGYAVVADPRRADSLAAALSRLADDPGQVQRMGEAGRLRVAADWNYEEQFAPLFSKLNSDV